MIVSFRGVDVASLVRLWNRFYPDRYAIDEDVFRRRTVDCPLFDWGASLVKAYDDFPDAFLVVKKHAAGLAYPGIKSDIAHVSAIAFQEPEAGVDVLAVAKTVLRERGITKLILGQDLDHFFPGCPRDFQALGDFLMIEGFEESGEVCDLERDLQDYEPRTSAPAEAELRRLAPSDELQLRSFLDREFPGRWTADTISVIEAEGRHDLVFGLFLSGELQGFALLQDSEVKHPIAGGTWRRDLGKEWGSLGPIGVSKHLRGRGLGDALLSQALVSQKQRGVRRCIVDWTDLTEFYQRHGFQVCRKYGQMSLPLE